MCAWHIYLPSLRLIDQLGTPLPFPDPSSRFALVYTALVWYHLSTEALQGGKGGRDVRVMLA